MTVQEVCGALVDLVGSGEEVPPVCPNEEEYANLWRFLFGVEGGTASDGDDMEGEIVAGGDQIEMEGDRTF